MGIFNWLFGLEDKSNITPVTVKPEVNIKPNKPIKKKRNKRMMDIVNQYNVNTRVDQVLHKRIKQLSIRNRKSMSDVMRKIIQDNIDRYEDKAGLSGKFRYLQDTIGSMLSNDWIERLVAEYYQVKIRIDSLNNAVAKHEQGRNKLDDYDLIQNQLKYMNGYLEVLKERLKTQDIEV